jgi:hypothetical protein
LRKVRDKLVEWKIPHYEYTEPDNDFGFTSIATIPLEEEYRFIFQDYRLLKFAGAEKSVA